ncbi:MAG: hypothetical protein GXX85_11930 [Ignavibacteria bacterium]|nr:hypothetical protein [Ignavibacteria bacterium]
MKSDIIKIFLLFIIIPVVELNAQIGADRKAVCDTFLVSLNNSYKISEFAIIQNSEIVKLNSDILGKPDYSIDYSSGIMKISDSLKISLLDTISVCYLAYNLNLRKEYRNRQLVIQYDDYFKDTLSVSKTVNQPINSETVFGPGIQKSGSIIRGFTVGNTKDMTVNSGLRLQMSGKLTDDIEIVAALTDENTPIQPEGNTERLDELDKVFIEVRHPNVTGTFGDFDYKGGSGEFGKIDRKLQGLKGEFFYYGQNAAVAFASSKGKFTVNKFNGTDGNQGPYRLYGENNERNIIVIAGSEKVFLNGEELLRGEGNDYTIEYSNSEIIFTQKRMITSASRISVDFEYSDRKFTRDFFGANLNTSMLNDKLTFKVNYYREGDDEKSPIDLSLSEDDIKILEKAGDNPGLAFVSGAELAPLDTVTGRRKGIYTKIDTVINNSAYTYYAYKPGEITSEYIVVFSYTGLGKGDYRKESLGNYEFAGIGGGSYMPIRTLPLPQLKQTANIAAGLEIMEGLKLDIEMAGSSFDKNRLSSADDKDNNGYARNISINLSPKDIGAGKLGFNLRDRFVEERFSSADRFNNVEFERDYNTSGSGSGNEILREAGLNYLPFDSVLINGNYGLYKKGSNFRSDRYTINSEMKRLGFDVKHTLDYVKSKSNFMNSKWAKLEAELSYNWNGLFPGVNYYFEDKRGRANNNWALTDGSLKYTEITPFLRSENFGGIAFELKYSMRQEFFPFEGIMEKESDAETKSLTMDYPGNRNFSTSLDMAFRKKNVTDKFKLLGYSDNETILIRSRSRANAFDNFASGDFFYEVSTQKTARLEKVFLRVEEGTGNYIYLGDLNNNGLPDENEFEQTIYEGDYILTVLPTDELYPIIDLKMNTRFQLEFSKLFGKFSPMQNYLGPLTTETLWRIEENSKEPKISKIYLLNFSSFLNETTTIRGSNLFQQDIFLFKNERDFSARLRFIERRNMNVYSAGLEKGYFREQGLRIQTKLVKEISNQSEYIRQTDNVNAPQSSGRARLVKSEEINTEFSYRPFNKVEIGFKFLVGKTEDRFTEKPTEINTNSQIVRLNISFTGSGRLRVEGERHELNASTKENYIPFEVTKGNQLGKNYVWRLMFDYRIADNLQTSVTYNGRLLGQSNVIHIMKAEVRAFF